MTGMLLVGTLLGKSSVPVKNIADLDVVATDQGLIVVAAGRAGDGITTFRITDPAKAAGLTGYSAYGAGAGWMSEPTLSVVGNGQAFEVFSTGLRGGFGHGSTFNKWGAVAGDATLGLPQDAVAARSFTQDGKTFVLLSRADSPVLETWRIDDGGARRVSQVSFAEAQPKAFAQAVAVTEMGGAVFAISASANGNFVTCHRIGADGAMGTGRVIGISAKTPFDKPEDIAIVESGGTRYVVVAGAGSSSLTMLKLSSDGSLTPIDHILDEGGTRFAKAGEIATITVDGRGYVFAAGGDDGITMFAVSPEGKLIHVATIADDASMPLNNVSALTVQALGGKIVLLAASSTERGIAQFIVDPGAPGETRTTLLASETGTAGGDLLVAGNATRALSGLEGDDTLASSTRSVTLTGGAGADVFVPTAVNGRITISDFNPAEDRLDLSDLGMFRSVEQLNVQSVGDGLLIGFGNTLLHIKSADGNSLSRGLITNDAFPIAHYPTPGQTVTLWGTPDDDLLLAGVNRIVAYGLADTDTIRGGAYDDFVEAGDGDDVVYGYGGNDSLSGGSGRDAIYGSSGSDTLRGRADADTLSGGVGKDWIGGGTGNDLLSGNEDDDRLYGEEHNDRLIGGDGNDRLDGGTGNDTLQGGTGNDWLTDATGENRFDGDEGNDRIIAGTGKDLVFGGTGDDYLRGGDANDLMSGGDGRDNIGGDRGDDDLSGGEGNDTLFGHDGRDRLRGDGGDDLLSGSTGADNLSGGIGNDTLLGGEGNDWLQGDDGNDRLDGSAGDDGLSAGAGDDVVYGSYGNDRISGGLGNDRLYGGADADAIFGDAGNDILVGLIGNDSLSGLAGNDLVDGGDGDDRLNGGTGADRINGGLGNDRIYGDEDGDKISAGAGNDVASGGTGDDLVDGSSGDDTLFGNDGNDTVLGGYGNDVIAGNLGDDRLVGGGGDDRMQEQAGANFLYGAEGKDTIIGGRDADYLSGGTDSDSLIGGSGRDTLLGAEGQDTLIGGTDNDVIAGGVAADALWGGAGADRFVFAIGDTGLGSASDRIVDFSRSDDVLDLRAYDLTFADAGFTGAGNEIAVRASGSGMLVEVDLNGDNRADFAIRVGAVTALDASDFLL